MIHSLLMAYVWLVVDEENESEEEDEEADLEI